MNYGILHNRRPAKSTDADFRNPLLSDVRMREMARQMGLESKDFGKEAMELWKTLDAMAESDPTAYQNFISDQLKDGPPSAAASAEATPTPLKAFNPQPGYVVKCTMMGPVKQQMVELKLFLNLCFHEIIDLPKNPNSDREVPRDTHAVPSTSNLQIPLVIGALREIKDFNGSPCRAIDVVFHPWVRERCEWDAKFKRDIMSLAISWVQHDAKVTLTSPVGKFIKSLYKGGVAVGSEIITARFPIEPEQQQTRTLDVKLYDDDNQSPESAAAVELKTEHQAKQEPKQKITMASPSDLLKKMSMNANDEEKGTKGDFLIAPAGQSAASQPTKSPPEAPTRTSESAAPQKKLIEVIESKRDNHSESAKPKPAKKSAAVKRGFLNAAKKPLYPTGSIEGRPASAYVNLLSRSKVVDLSSAEVEKKKQQEEAQRQREELASLIGMRTPSKSSTNAAAPNPPMAQEEQDHGDYEFERLCMEADPDLAPSNARAADPLTQGIFGEHLDEFAKFLSSQSG